MKNPITFFIPIIIHRKNANKKRCPKGTSLFISILHNQRVFEKRYYKYRGFLQFEEGICSVSENTVHEYENVGCLIAR
ncbi:hypothetical protein SATMO3_41190 [Sporomusa aerivorans]